MSVVRYILLQWLDVICRIGNDLDTGSSWHDILAKHPTVARALAERAALIITRQKELLSRIDSDANDIVGSGLLPPCPVLPDVAAISLGLGDPHCGHATVSEVQFVSETSIFFKPRPVQAIQLFEELCYSVLGGSDLEIQFPRRAAKCHYYWEEDARRESVECDPAVFYQRSGALLAIAQLARSKDLHGENIHLYRGGPSPIDCEIIAGAVRHADLENGRYTYTPVTYVGMLPEEVVTVSGNRRIECAFDSAHPDIIDRPTCGPRTSLPQGAVEVHIEDFVTGYELAAARIYSFTQTQSWHNWVGRALDSHSRFVARATQFYVEVIRKSLKQSWVGDAEDLGVRIENHLENTPRINAGINEMLIDEARFLRQGDVPTFYFELGDLKSAYDGRIIDLGITPAVASPEQFSSRAVPASVSAIVAQLKLLI